MTDSNAARIEQEREFHDNRFADDPREKSSGVGMSEMATIYAVRKTYATIQKYANGRILDYGCAKGKTSFTLVDYGAEFVDGIDLSGVAIEQAKASAVAKGISNIHFQTMNAEELEFDDGTFDMVCGFAILHHLDLPKAYLEISRVLKSNGHAVFLEPLGHNPAINAFRRATPALRTPDEHPFMMQDIQLAKDYFGEIDLTFHNCLSLASLPFSKFRVARTAFGALSSLDQLMFRVLPFTRRFAWNCVIDLSKPK